LLRSESPKICIALPKKTSAKSSSAAKQPAARRSIAQGGEWLSAKPKATKRKKATATKSKTTKKAKKAPKPKAAPKKKVSQRSALPKARAAGKSVEVIDLLSDEEESDSKPSPLTTKDVNIADELWEDPESESEYEFDE
jgi:hypothetical protein